MEGIKAESRLLTEELKGQITGVFQKLERKIQIIAILDPEEEKGKELGCFLMAIGTLHPMVEVSLYCCGENQELEQHFDPEMRPVSGIFLEDGNFTGAAFYGVPGGQELNSFIFAISSPTLTYSLSTFALPLPAADSSSFCFSFRDFNFSSFAMILSVKSWRFSSSLILSLSL